MFAHSFSQWHKTKADTFTVRLSLSVCASLDASDWAKMTLSTMGLIKAQFPPFMLNSLAFVQTDASIYTFTSVFLCVYLIHAPSSSASVLLVFQVEYLSLYTHCNSMQSTWVHLISPHTQTHAYTHTHTLTLSRVLFIVNKPMRNWLLLCVHDVHSDWFNDNIMFSWNYTLPHHRSP